MGGRGGGAGGIIIMKMLKFQPRLAIVTNTVTGAWLDLAHFGAIFTVFLVMMSVVAHVQFGGKVEETSTMMDSFNLLFIMLLGGSTGTEFLAKNEVKTFGDELAIGIFYTFMPVFFVLLMLNFLLGILGDSFGDEKEKLGEFEGDDLGQDVYKFVQYYARTLDPRKGGWPSHWTLRSAIKKAISAHEYNRLSDSEKEDLKDQKELAKQQMRDAEEAAAHSSTYEAARNFMAKALNKSSKAIGINSPIKSSKSPRSPGTMEKGMGFNNDVTREDIDALAHLESTSDDNTSELSEDDSSEVQEQVVIINGERMTREELVANLNQVHANYVATIKESDSAATKRRAVLGYSIESLVDQLVEFEYEDEMDEDSPEAIEYLQERAGAIRRERLEALRDQVENYRDSQEDAMAFNNAAVGWLNTADERLTQIEDNLTMLCDVMEREGEEIRGNRRGPIRRLARDQQERLMRALVRAREERAAIEEERKKQQTLTDMRERLQLGKSAGGSAGRPKLWGAVRSAAGIGEAGKKPSVFDAVMQLKAEGKWGEPEKRASQHPVASMFRRRRVERAQAKLKLITTLMAARKDLQSQGMR